MSNQNVQKGTVKLIQDLQTFPSGFQKRCFVVMTDGPYPQPIQFSCLKERVSLLDNIREGQTVSVHFNLNGREWEGKYFTDAVAWRVEINTTPQAETSGPSRQPEAESETFPF